MGLLLNYYVKPGVSDNDTTCAGILNDIQGVINGTITNPADFTYANNDGSTTITGTMPSQYNTTSRSGQTLYFKKDHSGADATYAMKRTIGIYMKDTTTYLRMGNKSGGNWVPYNSLPTNSGHGVVSNSTTEKFNVRWAESPQITMIFTPETFVFTVIDGDIACVYVVWDYQETEMDKHNYLNVYGEHCPTMCTTSWFENGFQTNRIQHLDNILCHHTTSWVKRNTQTSYSVNTQYSELYGSGYSRADDNANLTISPAPYTHRYIGVVGATNYAVLRRVGIEDNGWEDYPEFNDSKNFYRTSDDIGYTGDTVTIGSDTYALFTLHKTGFGSDFDNTATTRNAQYLVRL